MPAGHGKGAAAVKFVSNASKMYVRMDKTNEEAAVAREVTRAHNLSERVMDDGTGKRCITSRDPSS